MKVLITGTAGFIGFHMAKRLLENGHEVVGLDNINDYYDILLKYARLKETGLFESDIKYGKLITSKIFPSYQFVQLDLEDRENIYNLIKNNPVDRIVHLAAQAGVRYSLTNPHAYISSNVTGFLNILESYRHFPVEHLVYASSSSVYGMNEKMPFSVKDNVDHPVSLYAASKKANELMAHTYSHLYNIPVTGLRFFTVYGPWGRPDMALFLFTKAISEDKPIDIFNHGNMERDFTYIDDIIEGVVRVLDVPPSGSDSWDGMMPDPSCSPAPYRLYNIGNNNPVRLMDFIDAIEQALGKKAKKNFMPIQPGDVGKTWADTKDLVQDFDYTPSTNVAEGVKKFIDWYKSFYSN